MANIGELIDGKYEVLSLIGEGGMSRVWLARDQRLNKLWAVKEIGRTAKDVNNTIVVQSLVAEANLMKRLDHPALPRIVDIIEDGKTIFVVMDYIEGESLKEVIKRLGHALNEDDVIEWGIQLCDVLDYLHTRKPPVIYRDMKPSNIMLREDGSVKLIDFGIAREYKEDKSSDTQILGTRGYAAPEQFNRNVQTDPRTDIYSLGITLYHLVTGRGPSDDAVIRPIREINPRLSEGLEHIIKKATQQDPDKRYQSCSEMRYDLENYETLTEGYRSVQKAKVKRFTTLCVAAAVCAVVGIGGLVASTYFKNSTYESYMQQASLASKVESGETASPAEDAYTKAIETEPATMAPYQNLVKDVYPDDRSFTMTEAARWSNIFTAHQTDIEDSEEYAKLCYDVGTLYYVYYEQTEGNDASRTYAMTAGVQAAQWFQYAISSYDARTQSNQSCTLSENERRAAAAYVTIGEFYQKLSQKTLEGDEGSVYEGYWESLESAHENLSAEDAVIVKLRLYQLIYEAISSPTYLNGFKNVGVEETAVHTLLESVLNETRALKNSAGSAEKSQEMYNQIMVGIDQITDQTQEESSAPQLAAEQIANSPATQNINNVYGSAHIQALANAAAAEQQAQETETQGEGEVA